MTVKKTNVNSQMIARVSLLSLLAVFTMQTASAKTEIKEVQDDLEKIAKVDTVLTSGAYVEYKKVVEEDNIKTVSKKEESVKPTKNSIKQREVKKVAVNPTDKKAKNITVTATTATINSNVSKLDADPLENVDMIGDLSTKLTKKQQTQLNPKKQLKVKPTQSNQKQVVQTQTKKNTTNSSKVQQAPKADSITLLTNDSLKKYQKKSYSFSSYNDPTDNKSTSYQPQFQNYKEPQKKSKPRSRQSYDSRITHHPMPNGRKTSNFGYRRIFGRKQFHKGLDLAAKYGTPIYAAGAGTVKIAGTLRGYGRVVYIDHGNGLETRYAHNSRILVRKGQRVRAGQQISKMGCSGRCTGPHLHFEVRKNGKAQNPRKYIKNLR